MIDSLTLNVIGAMFGICDNKQEFKNAISSILNDNKKITQEPSIETYIKEKINVLKDFGISLSQEQLAHIETLPNEYAIDRHVRLIILRAL